MLWEPGLDPPSGLPEQRMVLHCLCSHCGQEQWTGAQCIRRTGGRLWSCPGVGEAGPAWRVTSACRAACRGIRDPSGYSVYSVPTCLPLLLDSDCRTFHLLLLLLPSSWSFHLIPKQHFDVQAVWGRCLFCQGRPACPLCLLPRCSGFDMVCFFNAGLWRWGRGGVGGGDHPPGWWKRTQEGWALKGLRVPARGLVGSQEAERPLEGCHPWKLLPRVRGRYRGSVGGGACGGVLF